MIIYPDYSDHIKCVRCGSLWWLLDRLPVPIVTALMCDWCWHDWQRIANYYKTFTYNRGKMNFLLMRYKWWLLRG